jgi:hypothetical protein
MGRKIERVMKDRCIRSDASVGQRSRCGENRPFIIIRLVRKAYDTVEDLLSPSIPRISLI